MTQPDLFTTPKPFINGRSTVARQCSAAGAKQVQPKAGSQADRILRVLLTALPEWSGSDVVRGGMTLHEIAFSLSLPLATVCARVGWLRQQGLVKPSGATRPGPTGVANHVLIAVDRGADEVYDGS